MIRCLSVLLVFLVAAAFSPAYARTGGTIPCTDMATTTCTSKQEALDIAKSSETATKQAVNYGNTDAAGYGEWTARYASHTVANEGTPSEYLSVTYVDVAPNGYIGAAGTVFFYWKPKECSPNDPPLSGGFMSFTGSEPGYQTCHDGCEYNPDSMTYKFGVVDGVKFVSVAGWIPSGASCTVGPNDGYVPPADTDHDGVSDSKDASPNNPGNSNAADDASNPKGDTKEDGHGSGNGNKSGGGGNCGNPPSSSGDEILAQIAYQTWATRCAIESTKDSSGTVKTTGGNNGGTVPIPGGVDMTETNSLLSAIKTYIKKVHDFIDSVTGEVSGLDTDKGEGASDLDHVWGSSSDEHDLDSSGFGWARSCPVLPSISIGGYSGQVDDGTLCTVMQAVGALVLLLAYFQAGLIIGRP